MKTKKIVSTALIAIVALFTISCNKKENISIIPIPVSIVEGKGTFELRPDAIINYNDDEAASTASFLAGMLNPATGYEITTAKGTEGSVSLNIVTGKEWKPEEYELIVTKKQVTINAGTSDGLFRGIQTLRQLLPAEIESKEKTKSVKWTVPCVKINDYPRFAWRGMHLDVSRHFFDVDFVKRYIDLIAMHKMNVFHWHLVDDQGWRIEIKKYPKLTETGAWRVDREDKLWNEREAQKPGEKATYGGFYTQEQVKEIVAYAAERHITIVPEIEMPAHVTSALAAYPQYSCTGGPFTVTTGGVWPITDIYCAGNDSTFKFLENVLTEVMDIFPSEYIHIGGDEAARAEWKKCPKCQARIRKEGLKDEAELQSYFIKRMEKFVSSKGRKIIGWDEILDGGIAPGAAVMSWRGFEGGIAAAKSGHKVVMAPVSHCYFDYYQGDPTTEPLSIGGYTTLAKVYSFEPVPQELTPEEARYVIGAQANLWTEYISTPSHAEYMVLPRMTALSEVLWSPAEKRNWSDFSKRLINMYRRFDLMGVNYSHGTYNVSIDCSFDNKTNAFIVTLSSEQFKPDIRYTTDGSEPTATSKKYVKPFKITSTSNIKAAVIADGRIMGTPSVKEVKITLSTGKKVVYNQQCSTRYKGCGDVTLVNGISGSKRISDGQWQGFEGNDMDVTIDLGKETSFSKITAGFLAAPGSWIFLPESVIFSVSGDGTSFTQIGTRVTEKRPLDQAPEHVDVSFDTVSLNARYVKIVARNIGTCPTGHEGEGGKAWIFTDEIMVEQ